MFNIKKLDEISLDEINSFGEILYTSEYIYEIEQKKNKEEISFKMNLVKKNDLYNKYIDNDVVTHTGYNLMTEHGYSLGAYIDDKLVGFLIAEERTWNNSVWVEMIRVADEHKGNGIGSYMLSALEKRSKERFNRIIAIETQNTNVPAINFYRKNGYEIDGLNLALYDPEECDDEIAVFMSKSIR